MKRIFDKLSPKATAAVFTVLLGAIVGLALPGPSAQTAPDRNSNPPATYQPGANTPDNRAYAEPNYNTKKSENATSPAKDINFAKKAAAGGAAEVKLGQLAEQKGQSQAVKDFGKRMVDDHSKANDKLQKIAAQDNVTLPTQLSPEDKQAYDRLAKLDGTAFDREYARTMVTDHQMDISQFKTEATNGADRLIKDFATNTLPTLQSHLREAQQMQKSVSSSANNHAGPSTQPATR